MKGYDRDKEHSWESTIMMGQTTTYASTCSFAPTEGLPSAPGFDGPGEPQYEGSKVHVGE